MRSCDEIGLFKPSYVDEQNGYYFYDKYTLMRMQEILFYRELDYPLKGIRKILSSLDYDKQNSRNVRKKQRKSGAILSLIRSMMTILL